MALSIMSFLLSPHYNSADFTEEEAKAQKR